MKKLGRCAILTVFITALSSQCCYCEDFTFKLDVDNEFIYSRLNDSSVFNKHNWRNLERINDMLKVTLEASVRRGDFRAHFNAYHRDKFNNFSSKTTLTRSFIDLDLNGISLFKGTSIRCGRQRIPWGTGLIWNPTDEINTPTDLLNLTEEAVQIRGEDAVTVNIPLGDASFTAVTLFDDPATFEAQAFRWRSTIAGFDFSLMGLFGKEKPTLWGSEFSKVIDDFTFWGEVALKKRSQLQDNKAKSFFNYVVGLSYIFPTEKFFQARAEYYHSEEGFANLTEYQVFLNNNPDKSARPAQIMRNYLYLGSTYDFTNDVIFDVHIIYNLDDESILFNPELKIILDERTAVSFHAALLEGDSGSEFGSSPKKIVAIVKLRRSF